MLVAGGLGAAASAARAQSGGDLQFTSQTYGVSEDAGSSTIAVSRTSGGTGAVSVRYATEDASAVAGTDYVSESGTLNWASGDVTNKTIVIPIVDRGLTDGSTRTLSLALSDVSGGANIDGVASATLTITENDAAPMITSPVSASGTYNAAFTPYQITATDRPTSFGATGLPNGLTVDTSSGLISGTPVQAGTFSVNVSAATAGGIATGPVSFSISSVPSSLPVITSATSAVAYVGAPFSYQITATNHATSFSAAPLPPGLSVDPATGVISGTPTAAPSNESISVTIGASNADGLGTASLELDTVYAPFVTSVGYVYPLQVGTPFSFQITADYFPTSFGAIGLPAGLTVNTSTGLISGTPTVAGNNFPVILSAANPAGTGTNEIFLTILPAPAAPIINAAPNAAGQVGQIFSYFVGAASMYPITFGATGLPAGLSINPNNGVISGVPTVSGTFSVVLSATNYVGTDTATLTLTIAPSTLPVITSAASAPGVVGEAFSYLITATNSPNLFGSSPLPDGLSLNTSTGLISGTPTNPATTAVSVSATNANGTTSALLTLIFSLAPPQVPVIISAASVSATIGQPFNYRILALNSPTSYGAGSLPAGLTATTDGFISGSPSQAGTFNIAISATNSSGTGTAALTLTVVPGASPPVVTVTATVPRIAVVNAQDGVFTLTRTGSDLSKPLVVTYEVRGTAMAGHDYSRLSGTKTIQEGKTSAIIKVVPHDQSDRFAVRTVLLVLQSSDQYVVGAKRTGEVKIIGQ